MPNFWFKFEWSAWRNDKQLRRCSKETRGFWIDCIAAMEEQETFFIEGTPEEICREVVADRGEFDRSIAELSRHGAATIEWLKPDAKGLSTAKGLKCQEIVKIISRRLLRKISITEYNTLKKRESRLGEMSNPSQRVSLKDIEFKNLRSLETSSNEEVLNSTEQREKIEQKILLPADYRPPYEHWQWGHENCKSLDLAEELEEFITYWREIATKNNKRTLRGWNATWKSRMKERQERTGIVQKNGTSKQNGSRNSADQRAARAVQKHNIIAETRARVEERERAESLPGEDADHSS
jgi:hypothetical protein